MPLGQVSNSNRSLCWRRDKGTVPESMSRDSEQGLAKLVLEKSEGPPLLVNMVSDGTTTTEALNSIRMKELNENTPQLMDEPQNTPDRPQKKKRRSSLNKEDKTPKGPSAKKQKTQVPKSNTRVRTPKSDTKAEKSPGLKKAKTGIKESSKAEKSTTDSKAEKSTNTDEQKLEQSLKLDTKPEKSLKSDIKAEKAATKVAKADMKTGKSPITKDTAMKEVKGGRKKSETKAKEAEASEVTQVNKTDASEVKEKKVKKLKKNTVKNEDTENKTEKCDKENVHIDSNVPVAKDIITSTKEKQPVREVTTSPGKSTEKKKVASCKDLTSRALARPSGRWGHSLCFVNKNLSVLIGGQGDKQQLNKDSVWTLDTETRRWKNPVTKSEGQKPEYRMGHTATYDPMVRCVYVYGGSKNARWFHDVHMLDIDEWKWQLVKVSGKAPTRAYHSATLYRHELWIFGGVYPRPDPQPDGCSNDIHIFSPVMESWYSPIVKGDKPIPRSGHSATLLNDQLVVFGGWDAPISYSDLHILDMSIVEWTQPKITGSPPSPRSWHASCALSNNRILIQGGYNGDIALEDTHIFNLDRLNWTQIKVENNPAPRVGHKALCMPYRHDNEEEDEVIIFGGGDNDGAYFEDLLSFYVPFVPTPVS